MLETILLSVEPGDLTFSARHPSFAADLGHVHRGRCLTAVAWALCCGVFDWRQTFSAFNKQCESVTVRINDRGPFVRGRVIDVTPAGAI